MQINENFINSTYQNDNLFARQGAGVILNSKGFVRDPERDSSHAENHGKTVSEIQGTQDLCQKVVQVTSKDPHALAPYNLRSQCNPANKSVFRHLCQRRMGHAFSLNDAKLPSGRDLISEGFNETFTCPMLQATFEDFARDNPDVISKEMKEWISKGFSSAIYNDNATDAKIDEICKKIKDPTCNEVIVVGSGWDWHLTVFIFYKGHFFFCNRGNQPLEVDDKTLYGWSAFKIGNLENVTPELIKHLAQRMSYIEQTNLNIPKVIEKLSASFIFNGKMQEQKIGNCTYANFKAAFSCLFAIWEYEKTGNVQKLEVVSFEDAFKKATQLFYKPFTRYDRQELLKDSLIDLEFHSNKKDLDVSNPDFQEAKGLAQLLYNKIVKKSNVPMFYGQKVDWDLLARLSIVFTKIVEPSFESTDLYKYFINHHAHSSEEALSQQQLFSLVRNSSISIQKFIEEIMPNFEFFGIKTFEQSVKICNFIKSCNLQSPSQLIPEFDKFYLESIKSTENIDQRLEKILLLSSLEPWAFSRLGMHFGPVGIKYNDEDFFRKLAVKTPNKTLDIFLLAVKGANIPFKYDDMLKLFFKMLTPETGDSFPYHAAQIHACFEMDLNGEALEILHRLLEKNPQELSKDQLNCLFSILQDDDEKKVCAALRILTIAIDHCKQFKTTGWNIKIIMNLLLNLLPHKSKDIRFSALECFESFFKQLTDSSQSEESFKDLDLKEVALKLFKLLDHNSDDKSIEIIVNILRSINSKEHLDNIYEVLTPEIISLLLKDDQITLPLKAMRLISD